MDRAIPVEPAVLEQASSLLAEYDVVFCDVWGVLHNGASAHSTAGEALASYRRQGGTVVLVSNAPLPSSSVATLLADRRVRRDAWDTIVSSGDLTRNRLVEQRLRHIHHIGPDRDLVLFRDLDVELVTLRDAEAVVCSGVVDDENETGESYRSLLEHVRRLNLPLICANPDLVVEVADVILPCAGSVAVIYESMGGEVYWAGKPYRVAYEAAHASAERLVGHKVERARILAIGDAIRTDIAGARAYGIDSLFITEGIHREELIRNGHLDRSRLDVFLARIPVRPKAVMARLSP
jgi:HAD superfamily hydrolase (TIGR01459 family)